VNIELDLRIVGTLFLLSFSVALSLLFKERIFTYLLLFPKFVVALLLKLFFFADLQIDSLER
jgi:hypothetical protein